MTSPAKLVFPHVEGTLYRWTFGDVSFEVDAGLGARILGFRMGSENILVGPQITQPNFGSTFWTSPQSDWNWPPVPEIDSRPYQVQGTGTDLWFHSVPGAMGIAVAKQFRVDSDQETVDVEYVMENRGDKTLSVAPWEISRLPTGGLTFFPTGAGIQESSTLTVREAGGAIWFENETGPTGEHRKLFAHGSEGWVAHIDMGRRMLLVKTFPSVAPGEQAPGEAEIEFYEDPAHTYFELEQQGRWRPLAPGERTSWTVTWRLRRLPSGIDAVVGNKDLLALVRAVQARDRSPE